MWFVVGEQAMGMADKDTEMKVEEKKEEEKKKEEDDEDMEEKMKKQDNIKPLDKTDIEFLQR